MQEETATKEILDVSAVFGFPESVEFSLENSHFYLDDHRYTAFCVAMQRAHQRGLVGTTRADVAAAWHERQSHQTGQVACQP